MKMLLTAIVTLAATSALAEGTYCKLENVPAVKAAVAKALKAVTPRGEKLTLKGPAKQIPIKGSGDAFDQWGDDLIVYELDGIGLNEARSVAVKVTYTALMAQQYVSGEDATGDEFLCADTGAVNPELIYFDVKDAKIIAKPYNLIK